MENAILELEFLLSSPNRVHVIRWLTAERELSQRELKDRCEVSRPTLQRNLAALEDRGWLERDNRTYTLTPKGEWIAGEFSGLLELVETILDLEPFLNYVSSEALDFDIRHLSDAQLTVADAGNPYAPVNDHIMAMKGSESFRAILPSIGLHPMEVAAGRVNNGCEHEVILGAEAAITIREERTYRDAFEALLEADNCRILCIDMRPPFYLGLVDDSVQIGVEDGGKPHALIEVDEPEVRAWAEETFDEYRTRAEPFSRSVVSSNQD